MNERIDEEIGALLDGRVDARRRDELLARLATAGDDYDVFADTAAVLREAEGGVLEEVAEGDRQDDAARSAPVIPLRPRRAGGWRSPAVRALAAAAVLATITLIPVLRSRANDGAWRDLRRVAEAGGGSSGLPTDWPAAWSALRGGVAATEELPAAARVGALLVDGHVAAAAGDTAGVAQAARQIGAITQRIGGAGFLSAEFDRLAAVAQAPGVSLADSVTAAGREAERFFSSGRDIRDYFALGGWTEAARLAARRQDADFFASPLTARALDRASALPLNDRARGAITQMRSVHEHRAVRDWDALYEAVTRLLDTLAR